MHFEAKLAQAPLSIFTAVFEIKNATNEVKHGNGRRLDFITLGQVEGQVFQKLLDGACDRLWGCLRSCLLFLEFLRHFQVRRKQNL